jgi:hypothetical protein
MPREDARADAFRPPPVADGCACGTFCQICSIGSTDGGPCDLATEYCLIQGGVADEAGVLQEQYGSCLSLSSVGGTACFANPDSCGLDDVCGHLFQFQLP